MFSELFYIYIVTTAFEIFGCMPQHDGRQTLFAEPRIFCYEDEVCGVATQLSLIS